MKKQTVQQGKYYKIIHEYEDKEYTEEEIREAKERALLHIYKVVYNQ